MNIDDKSQFRSCSSCQMCGAVCPTGAISIKLNRNGFYRPIIDSTKCINCSLCVKSCYKFDNDIRYSNLGKKQLFAAWANNPEIVCNTTSGGIADIMARKLIEKGYKCIGVTYDSKSNRALGAIAETIEDTLPFRGSKYIQSYSVDVFKLLVKSSREEKYAVFGLPCQIYAIDRFLCNRGDRDNHLLIDLYCHGCPSMHLWDKYLEQVFKRCKTKSVISANFRSKIKGWGKFSIEIVLDKNKQPIKVVSPSINDGFYELFFSDLVLNQACPDCQTRSTLEYCDIRLGDFWGREFIRNDKGVSAITISSNNGKELLDSIKYEIIFKAHSFFNFIPYQSYGRTYTVNKRIRHVLLEDLSDHSKSIQDCVAKYHSLQPPKAKIKRFAKNIVKVFPNSIASSIKDIFYKFQN